MTATFWAAAAVGAAAAFPEYQMAMTLMVVVFFAHVALCYLSAWIGRTAPPKEVGPK